MNKENVLFGIIGLLVGLIVGFTVTNYINRNSTNQIAGTVPSQQQLPQVNNQVVRDQTQTGGKTNSAPLPQIQETLDLAKNAPQNFEAQMAAAEMYYKIQRFEEAAEYFEKASKLKPDSYNALVMAGNSHYDARQFETAAEWYLRALAIKPDDVGVRTDLGVTFVERSNPDLDRAIAEFRGSLKRNPRHEQTLNNLAIALNRKGDAAGLNETLAQLAKVNPNNPLLSRLSGEGN